MTEALDPDSGRGSEETLPLEETMTDLDPAAASTVPESSTTVDPLRRIGPYTVVRELGEGGFG